MNRSTLVVIGLMFGMMLFFAFLSQIGTDWWMAGIAEGTQRSIDGEIDIEKFQREMAEAHKRNVEAHEKRQAEEAEAAARAAAGFNWLSVAVALGAGCVLVVGGIGAAVLLKEEEEELPKLEPLPATEGAGPAGAPAAEGSAPAAHPAAPAPPSEAGPGPPPYKPPTEG